MGQRLQHLVEVGRTQSALLTDECLVDIAEVGKQSTVIAQKADDDLVLPPDVYASPVAIWKK